MKIVFMGTPDFSVPVLKALAAAHEVVCVYTQPPREAGRGNNLRKTPVHLAAETLGIEVRHPVSLKSAEEQAAFKALNADVAVVAAYGLLLPPAILEAFPKGCLNIHASLLPRWRGAAPIQRAIEAGDKKSGVTIMQMDKGLDTGAMLLKAEVEIDENTTGETLHDALSAAGSELILNALARLGTLPKIAQPEQGVTYAAKLDKAESRLDFRKSAVELERKIRAFCPYPGTYFEYEGERFKVLKARVEDDSENMTYGKLLVHENRLMIICMQGLLEILEIQRQGKKPMPVAELLRGFKFRSGAVINYPQK